jgi:hypothetical protein
VCGSNMRCFLNVSCICAMSHHLQESARKNTQKNRNQAHHVTLFASTIEGEVFARNVTVEAFAAMANRGYGAVIAEGRQDVIMGNKEANALSAEEKGYVRIASSGIGAPIVTFRNKLERNCLCFAALLCLLFIYYSSCSSVLCHICAVWSCC